MKIKLGKTGLLVCKDGFGALPAQRAEKAEAVKILRAAREGGIDFFDTARMYTDSEEKIGAAFELGKASERQNLVIATKTTAEKTADFERDLEISLRTLKTDYIDVYQFHNLPFVPRPGDGTGLYEAMLAAREAGKIRFIGFTNHRLHVAEEAVKSALYDTLQFPFNYLATEGEMALVNLCERQDVGFIAMKALSGGLLTNIDAARSWIHHFAGAVPIWGIQRMGELEALFASMRRWDGSGVPRLDAEQKRVIEKDRAELKGEFCRGCGYCMPCPKGIIISMCARMHIMLRRAPVASYTTAYWKAEMAKIAECENCGQCKSKCPYNLDTPALLKKSYEDYKTFIK